jgi:hypothetical protein
MKFDLILNRIIPGLSSTKAAKPVDRFRGLSLFFRVLGFEFFFRVAMIWAKCV